MVLLVVGAAPRRVGAEGFSAEMVEVRGGETSTATFHFQDGSYRFELREGENALVVAFDAPAGVLRVIAPAEKMYYELAPDSTFARMVSPFAWHAHCARTMEVRTEGTEPIAGMACTRQVAARNEQVFSVAWVSAELAFPLKVEVAINAQTVELRNIQRGPQDAALFAAPAGFRQAPAPSDRPEVPDWAADVASAPWVTAPGTHVLAEGKMVRLRPKDGKAVRAEFRHAAGESSAFVAVGFKDGRPTSDISGNTFNLSPTDVAASTLSQTPAEVDEVVIRCTRGSIKVDLQELSAEGSDAGTLPAAAASEPEAELQFSDTVPMASQFEVAWSGPGANEDSISVARPGQPPGAYLALTRIRGPVPVQIWAPSEPGEFEVRYLHGRPTKVLAAAKLTVTPVTAGVQADGPVKVAAWIEATWEGPAGETDYISVARVDHAPGAYVNQTRVKQGNPARLRAPSDPGDYEIRYVLGRGNKVLARAPIVVEAVAATVQTDAAVKAGAEFPVAWTGPAYPEDIITIALATHPPGGSVVAKRVSLGNPLKLKAPLKPGAYEVRYLLGRGNRVLARVPIIVEAP